MNYIDYYPPILKDIYEIQLISSILDEFFKGLNQNCSDMLQEFFLSTATETGISIWENMLGMEVTDTDIEIRRFKVRSKLLGDNTSLRTKLNLLLGEGKYKITVYPKECYIVFNLELSVQGLKSAVIELLEKVLPVNLTYEINFAYNRHEDLKPYTHGELQAYTYKELNAKKL